MAGKSARHSTLISRGCHYASTTIQMSDAGPYQKQHTEKRMYCFRPLDPLYAERWQTTRVGKRGGLEVRPPFIPHVAVTPQQYFEVHPPTKGMLGTRMSTLSLVLVHVLKLQCRILRSLCLQMADRHEMCIFNIFHNNGSFYTDRVFQQPLI